MKGEAPMLSARAQRWTQAREWLLDLVFPPLCGHCGRVDFRFCPACQTALAALPPDISYRQLEHFAGLCASGKQAGILESAVRSFKYEGATELAEPLAARLSRAIDRQRWQIDCILPVPLFADRLRERGYNQAYLLCQRLAAALSLRCRNDYLERIRSTSQQARLKGVARQRNVRGAFAASEAVGGLSLLLVDDVLTTGATLRECAAALRAKNARAVYGVTVSQA